MNDINYDGADLKTKGAQHNFIVVRIYNLAIYEYIYIKY